MIVRVGALAFEWQKEWQKSATFPLLHKLVTIFGLRGPSTARAPTTRAPTTKLSPRPKALEALQGGAAQNGPSHIGGIWFGSAPESESLRAVRSELRVPGSTGELERRCSRCSGAKEESIAGRGGRAVGCHRRAGSAFLSGVLRRRTAVESTEEGAAVR